MSIKGGALQGLKVVQDVDDVAEYYRSKYTSQIDKLESRSAVSKVRTVTAFDVRALGMMLEQWDNVMEYAEADSSIADLGVLPRIAHDVISVSYGTNPATIVASTQPIEEELGLVYYKSVKAKNTAGNFVEDETIADPRTGLPKVPRGYASSMILAEDWGTADGSLTNFAGTASNTPIRPSTVTIKATIGAAEQIATDDGNGKLIGAAVDGGSTIDYASGAFSITWSAPPDNATTVSADYAINLEAAADINSIGMDLASARVQAQTYALKGTLGMLKTFAFRKRFGKIGEDELALDLVNVLNAEVFGDLVRKMSAAAKGNTTWSKSIVAGVSAKDHRDSFKFSLATAESVLVGNAGRGARSFYIGGITFCEYVSTLPGWTLLYDGATISGAHLYGTLDGLPVIRVPLDATLISPDEAVVGFKGMGAFEAAAVIAPYMALTVTSMLPTANPLVSQRAAATWVAVEVLIPEFLTKFTLIP